MKIDKIRKDFPIFNNNGKLIYLDNAATTQRPNQVINSVVNFYKNYNANIHRGVYKISEEATLKYEAAHDKVAKFINANSSEEIIFTKNATEALNLVAYTSNLNGEDEIMLTKMEHHSNTVPWQQLALRTGAKLNFIDIDDNGELKDFSLNKNTKILAITHVSNVLGTINNIKELSKTAHENDALIVVDGAQSAPHISVDVKNLDVDFFAFSGHKMLAPTGIGCLYGKRNLLESREPFLFGGDMIREVNFKGAKWNDLPWKYEAGTANIAGGIGLSAAVDYLNKIGMENVEDYEKKLATYALDKLSDIKNIKIYGPKKRAAIISFNLKGIHAHDIATLLDSENIAIRGGHHCAMPLMQELGIKGSARASFYIYNTKEEIDLLAKNLEKANEVFKK